jgi:type IV pilus assembly protein PilB
VELLDLDDDLREMIMKREPVSKLKKAARENGTVFLRDSAVEKFASGITSLREVNRVTFAE